MCGPSKEERQTHLDKLFAQMQTYDVPAMHSAAIAGGIAPSQICRTCSKSDTQRVRVSIKEMGALKKANGGVLPADAYCQPEVTAETRRVAADRSISKIDTEGKVKVHLQTRAQRAATVALADTCGQSIQEKCTNCVRFERITARVQGGVNANGRPYFIDVLIGGHCKISEEGIVINGVTTFCDKQLRLSDPLELNKTCSTCRWQTSYSTDNMLDHVTPLRGDLTPYEMEVARTSAHPDEVGMAIAEARRSRTQVRVAAGPHTKNTTLTWTGMLKFYRLSIVKIHEDVSEKPVSVDLRVFPSGDIFNFNLAEGDDSIGMVKILNTQQAILEITSPHHRKYGLPDNDRISYPQGENLIECPTCLGTKKNSNFRNGIWEDILCNRCGGTGQVSENIPEMEVIDNNHPERVDPNCTQCKGHVPCYHHLRSAYLSEEISVLRLVDGHMETTRTSTLNYRFDDTRRVIQVASPERQPRFIRDASGVRLVDGNGNPPNFTIFRLWYRSAMEWCKTREERAQIIKQFTTAKDAIPHTRPRRVDFSWSAPAPVDAWHPFCSLNLFDRTHGSDRVSKPTVQTFDSNGEMTLQSQARGLDFMHEWNDQFGTPRSDMSTNPIVETYGHGLRRDPMFSWAKWQENEEWLRVNNSGEKVQDEFLASEKQLKYGRQGRGTQGSESMPSETVVVQLGVGIPNTNLQFGSSADALDWLDEEMVMPGNDEAAGFTASRRWFALGYENFRNTKRLLEDDVPSVFEFNHHQPMGDESTTGQETPGFYACSRCYDPTDAEGGAGKYTPEEIGNMDLTCPDPDCDGILVFMSTRDEWMQESMRFSTDQIDPDEPYRRRSGSPDTFAWQQTERLMSMSCPNWAPRRNWARK